MYIVVEENSGINSESFADIKLYRPRSSSELKIRLESESHLRSKFDVGVYTNPKEINQILLHQLRQEKSLRKLWKKIWRLLV